MFVNYLWEPTRDSPMNLVLARVVVSFYAIWKLLSYGWSGLTTWPEFVFYSAHPPVLIPIEYIWVEVAITIGALLLVAAGRYVHIAGFTAALLLAHLTGIHYAVTNQASTFLPTIYFLILLAIYSDISSNPLSPPSNHDENENYVLSPLRWLLLIVAGTYFFAGFAKVQSGVFAWASGDNIGRAIIWESTSHVGGYTDVGLWLLDNPIFLDIIGWCTIIFEVGLLIALLARLPIWPFVIGLLGVHFGIALSMQIVFFDQPILFALFLPWDKMYGSFSSRNPKIGVML
jgi:hypothetical protein